MLLPLSPPTQELIHKLYSPRSFVVGRLGLAAERTGLIARIAGAGEPAAIPTLLPLTLVQGDVPEAASTAVSQVLEAVPLLDLVDLDLLSRSLMPSWDTTFRAWRRLTPEDLPRLARLQDGWAVLAMAASHPSGHIREAALRLLPAAAGRRALPFLLLRMNDWVDPVRRAAAAEVEAFMGAPDPEALVDALPLVLRMRSWRRRDHRPFIEEVLQLLRQPASRTALARGLDSPDRTVRRECFRLALEPAALDSASPVERALADPDPWVRHLGALRLEMLGHEQLRHALQLALADSSAAVRCEAMRCCVARFPSEAALRLWDSLLDPHPSVRELARLCLQQGPEGPDLAAFYREALRTEAGRRLRAAILGLSETALPADTQSLLPFCVHPQAKVREAAVQALGRLDAPRHRETILAALADPSRRVSNEAARIIAGTRALLAVEFVGEFARSDNQPHHVRLNALRLLSGLGKWASLPFFLSASSATDPNVAAAACAHVEQWVATYNQSFLRPSAAQLQAIDQALPSSGDNLKSTLRDSIRAAVNYWRSNDQ